MGTICGSVLVQRDRVGMYMAILRVINSLWSRRSRMYRKTGQNRISEQNQQPMTRILEATAMT